MNARDASCIKHLCIYRLQDCRVSIKMKPVYKRQKNGSTLTAGRESREISSSERETQYGSEIKCDKRRRFESVRRGECPRIPKKRCACTGPFMERDKKPLPSGRRLLKLYHYRIYVYIAHVHTHIYIYVYTYSIIFPSALLFHYIVCAANEITAISRLARRRGTAAFRCI